LEFKGQSIFEENLHKYLEIESVLNELFRETDFCLKRCILEPGRMFPNPGCCVDRYYQKYDLDHPAFELLKSRRELLFGTPEKFTRIKRISPCEYHTLKGCRLITHKSPICLSFFCREGIDHLRERHGVMAYDYLGVHYALEWILTGDMTGSQYAEFKASCLTMVEKIKDTGPVLK
jgi:hypothetical protein